MSESKLLLRGGVTASVLAAGGCTAKNFVRQQTTPPPPEYGIQSAQPCILHGRGAPASRGAHSWYF
jgi:hypothetical protein